MFAHIETETGGRSTATTDRTGREDAGEGMGTNYSAYWLDEAVSTFRSGIGNSADIITIQKQIQKLSTKDFWSADVLHDHALQKQIEKHKLLFDGDALRVCLESYNIQCHSILLEKRHSISKELEFFAEFVRILKHTADKSFVSAYRTYVMNAWDDLEGMFSGLLLEAIYRDNEGDHLAAIANTLLNEKHFYLAEQFFSIASRFFEPLKVKISKFEDIVLVQVSGSAYSLSDVFHVLESEGSTMDNPDGLKIADADEFHLTSHLSIDLDSDFIYPGKNLLIKTARLKCFEGVLIDVSGKDKEFSYKSDPGTDSEGNGRDGGHGYAGQSAGNVLIEAEQMVGFPNVIANGGKGSSGQDGGSGKDGQNGEGMTIDTLKETYSPPAAFVDQRRHQSVLKIINNIDTNLKSVDRAYYSGEDASTNHGVWENIKAKKNGTLFGIQRYTLYFQTCIYLRVNLNCGKKLTFAFEYGGMFTNCQSYLLVEGTSGTMGDAGGSAGIGGQGGFAGSISINQKLSTGTPGADGSNGKPGKHGHNGKNGWDVAWFDYSFSGAFGADSWPKYYGGDHNTKLELKAFEASTNNRIVCTYRRYVDKSDYMMEVFGKRVEHPKQRQITTDTNRKGQAKHQTVAKRMSNVHVDVVRQEFSNQFSAVEQMMASLRNTHKSAQEITPQGVHLQQHQNQVKADMTVNRQIEFTDPSRTQLKGIARSSIVITKTQPLWNSDGQMFYWELFKVLGKIKLSTAMIQKLCHNYERCKISCDDNYLLQANETSADFGSLIAFFGVHGSQTKNKIKANNVPSLHMIREFVLDVRQHGSKDVKELFQIYEKFHQRVKDNLIVFEESMAIIDKKCQNNKKIMKLLKNHLKEKPSMKSNCHVQQFAELHGINIQVYHEDQLGKFIVSKNFNSKSKRILRVIEQDGHFYQLKHNFFHFKLEEERLKRCAIFGCVLSELLRFTTIQELSNYERRGHFMGTQPFTSPTYQAFAEYIDVGQAISEITKVVPDKEFAMSRMIFITEPYIGNNRILKALRDRLCFEGGRVSSTELCFFINTTLEMSQCTDYFEDIMLWIITATDQQNWVVECAVLQIENYFKRSVPDTETVKAKLQAVDDKNVVLLLLEKLHLVEDISLDVLVDIIISLEKSTTTSTLEGQSLPEWIYVLRLGYWTSRLLKVAQWDEPEGHLERVSHYLPTLEITYSESLLKNLFDIFEAKSNLTSAIIIQLFQSFYSEQRFLNDAVLSQLRSNPADEWLRKLAINSGKEARTLSQLVTIINNNSKVSLAVKEKLNSVTAIVTQAQLKSTSVASYSEVDIKAWRKQYGPKISLEETLAVIDRAIFLKEGFALRDSQKLSIVLFYAEGENNRVLEQVSTGEGKSLIVAAIAIIKVLKGEKVDVITSSSVLARRDAEANRELFGIFDLKVDHNCSESLAERTDAYKSGVVYGEISNFQRDYLLDRFYGKNIFGSRNFENLIVDEVDSMLLDKGNNVLYLSHQIPAFDKLEIVFRYIWQLVNRPAQNQEDYDSAQNSERLRENVIDNLYKRITKRGLQAIMTEETMHVNNLWTELIKEHIINERGRLQAETVDFKAIEKLTSIDGNAKKRLRFHLCEAQRKQCLAVIPNFLIPFVEEHLSRWIENAKIALVMTSGNDYVVDIDRTGMRNDLNANITILDRDTETDQASCQWEEGLHQFLQLKHGCRVSLMSLKAIFISNVSYFKLYKNMYGLTGTLGSRVEMELLQEIHGVEYVTIPTSCGKKFVEETSIICASKRKWLEQIEKEVRDYTEKNHRSILIISETVESVNIIQKRLVASGIKNIFAYRREHDQFTVAENLTTGQVIIATNLAGRGTNIKISKPLRDNGGLHICLTYLPTNKRVEEQAFGRTARSGDPGSGRLVIMEDGREDKSGIQMISIKKARDCEEIKRISDVKENYNSRILAEEFCFDKFHKVYDSMQLSMKDVSSAIRVNYLENLIDQWALWLDKWRHIIRNDHNSAGYKTQLSAFADDFGKFPLDRQKILMSHAITHGKILTEEKKHEPAIEWFRFVIKQEPAFSEAAHYYLAFAIGKTFNWEFTNQKVRKVKAHLRTAKRMFQSHCDSALQCSAIVNKMKEDFQSGGVVQINSYEEQKQNIVRMYDQFIASIDDAIGSAVTPESFISGTTDDHMSSRIYDDLRECGVLNPMQPQRGVDVCSLNEICLNYGIDSNMLKNVLNKLKDADQNEMLNSLTSQVDLPNRDDFWTELLNNKFLKDPTTYVVFDESALIDEYPSMFTKQSFEGIRVAQFKKGIEVSKSEMAKTIEQITEMDLTRTVLRRDSLKKFLGSFDYQTLVRKRLISEIETAILDTSVNSFKFKRFDNLLKSDFCTENIDSAEVDAILTELVKAELIIESAGAYSLGASACIQELRLPKHLSMYEYTVIAILQSSFCYRLAFNRIQSQIKDDSWPLKTPLIHKPHQSLFYDLVDANIIRPITVNKNADEKSVLEKLYPETMSFNTLALLLKRELPHSDVTSTIAKLLEYGCINKGYFSEYEYSLKDKAVAQLGQLLNIELPLSDGPSTIRTILESECMPKGFSEYSIQDKAVTHFENAKINENLTRCLKREATLRSEASVQSVVSSISHLKGFIAALDTPQPYLQVIYDAMGAAYHGAVEEVSIFTMNGLGEIIRFKEKQWTLKMIASTSAVIALGLCQIALGCAIELFSVGLMTNVGVGLLSEGIGDMMFAMSALRSGYFSWASYLQHKKESLMITVVTCGVGALCSRGAQISRYGQKLAEQTFEIGGKAVSEMCGKELIKAVGWEATKKKVLQEVCLNTLKGAAFGLTSAEVGRFVENHLQSLCDGMVNGFMNTISEKTAKHEISKTIGKVYVCLAPTKGRILLDSLTKASMQDVNMNNTWATTFLRLGNTISRGIGEGIQKKKNAGATTTQNLLYIASYLGKGVDFAARANTVYEMGTMIDTFLDELNKSILNSPMVIETERQDVVDNVSDQMEFEKTSSIMIRDALQRHCGQMIAHKFVAPIMQIGAAYLVTYVGSQIKKQYKSYRNRCYSDKFRAEQKQYQENAKNAVNKDAATRNDIVEEYMEKLNDLKGKVRDPKLYAAIVREGGHVDMVGLKACAANIDEQLVSAGSTKGYIFIVEGENGVSDRCYSGNQQNPEIVRLKLTDNHFVLLDNNNAEIFKSNSGYNCLFESLQDRIPELRGETADTFRAGIANRIATDPNLGNSIRRGFHTVTLRHGMYGGSRTPPRENDINSTPSRFDFEGPNYRFNNAFDTSLRTEGETGTSQNYTGAESREVLKEGLETALQKVNQSLQACKDSKEMRNARGNAGNVNTDKVFNDIQTQMSATNQMSMTDVHIKADDLNPINYVEGTDDNGNKINIQVEYEATVKVKLPLSRSGTQSEVFEFKVQINLDNPTRDESGPQAPHIGYSCQIVGKPAGCSGFKTVVGHVLVPDMIGLPGRTKNGMKTPEEVRREVGTYAVPGEWLGSRKIEMRRSRSLSK